MHDVPAQLLAAALQYAVARVRSLATVAQIEALVGRAAADVAAVQAHLTAAAGHADAAAAALTARDLPTAARQAGLAVGRILDALRAADPAAVPDALVRQVMTAAAPGALVRQLALPAPTPKVVGRDLQLAWTADDVDVALFRIRILTLTVILTPDAGLAMTLRAEGARVDLGAQTTGLVNLLIGAAGSAETELSLRVDDSGFTVSGSTGPIALPGRLATQVVDLDGLELSLVPRGDRIDVEIRSRVSAEIAGVITARVDGAGLALILRPEALLRGDAAFWRDAAALTPVAPRGIGLAIEAGPARGGGYLATVPGGFGGALELSLGPVQVTGYGLLFTDRGALGFVAVVSVRFVVPIELGFLFTLNAVGGVVGLGVDIDTARLAAGLKDGILDSLFFPDDVVAAAPTILATLAAVFPRHPGGFVIGPMVQLGWGRPISLATLDVGVIIAVPDPVVVIIGRARSALPHPDAAIIDIRAAVLVQVGRGIILLRAELYQSRIAFLSVSGGIGMLVRFGDDATVVFSAGGFHPTYAHKPPELADLSRIGAELSPPIGLQLRLQGYIAITPNTLQFGGSIEIGLSIGVAAVRGRASLDTIIQFDPFRFTASISASAHVEVFGISLLGVALALEVSGPGPFRISGTGRITLPWPLPDPSLDFGPIEIGDGPPPGPPPPSVRPLPLVAAALRDPDAWRRIDRVGQRTPVRLAALPEGASGTIVEPWGLLAATQRAFPLDMTIERVGSAPVEPAGCRLRVARVAIGSAAAGSEVAHSPLRESFPIGQFLELTKDEQLRAPEFEDRTGGLAIDPDRALTGAAELRRHATDATLEYEDHWADDASRRRGRLLKFAGWELSLLGAGPVGATALRTADRYAPAEDAKTIEVLPASASRVTDIDTGAEIAGIQPWSDALQFARRSPGGIGTLTRVGMP